MTGEPPVSRWARSRFGDRTHQVRRGVVEALQQALNDAQNAQQVSRSTTRHPFGATVLTRKHETLAAVFRHMDGVQIVRSAGSPFDLVVLNGNLLFPFRYAQDATVPIREARITDRHVSERIRMLFSRFGPRPAYKQDSLLPEDADQEPELAALGPALAELPADTRLVLVAFACNDQAGLINAWWGEAELTDELGRLRWVHPAEELPLPKDPPAGGQLGAVQRPPGEGPQPPARFDSGDIPGLATETRDPLKRHNSDQFPPDSETPPGTADAGDDEQQ